MADGTEKLEGARAVFEKSIAPAADPPKKRQRTDGLPDDCPVQAVGVNDGTAYFIDVNRQLRAIPFKGMSKNEIRGLFGHAAVLLENYWPRITVKNDQEFTTGWQAERAAEALIAAASKQGIWNAFDRERGRGAWTGDNDEIVLHCGDSILIGTPPFERRPEYYENPGLIGRHIYPAAAKTPRPHASNGGTAEIEELLDIIKTWNWVRPETDPYFLLGWIGAAFIGGALNWRPCVWITGDKGTGKSTLQKVVKWVLDDYMIAAADASAAGIWQELGISTRAVAIDEAEATIDNRKMDALIGFARTASSGALLLRGGQDHKGVSFKARSCFLFSSILVPPLLGQDRSRIAILELGEVSGDMPKIKPERMREIGTVFLRRLLNVWPKIEKTFTELHSALQDAKMSSRSIDQYGTLVTLAELLMHDDEMTSDDILDWVERLRDIALAEKEENQADHERCMAHLMTSTVDAWRSGEKLQVSELVATAAGRTERQDDRSVAGRTLERYGLKYIAKGGAEWLAVANQHQGLLRIFQNTHWGGRSGAQPVYVQTLRRIRLATLSSCIRYNGTPLRSTLIPLDEMLPKTGGDDVL